MRVLQNAISGNIKSCTFGQERRRGKIVSAAAKFKMCFSSVGRPMAKKLIMESLFKLKSLRERLDLEVF